MNRKKEYGISAVILLIGFAVSAWILLYPKADRIQNKPPPDGSGEEQLTENGDEKESENIPSYTVRFCDEEGNTLETKSVKEGESVLPPDYSSDGKVLKRWDHALFSVLSDETVCPVTEDISDNANVFYADAVYVRSGENVDVKVMLDGKVDCCDFVLTVRYDNTLLRTKECRTFSEALSVADEPESGVLTLTYDGSSLNEKNEIANICFEETADGMYASKLIFATKEIHKRNADGVTEYTDSVAYETNIFILR